MSSERQVTEKEKTTLEGVVPTNPGKHIAPVYKRVFDSELNRMVVKKVDETNLYEFIQASKSETDLATLQKRFIALGEIPAVDPSMGEVDTTLFPNNIHELYGLVNDLNRSYSSLPASIQQIFGSAEEYGKAVMDGTYAAKISQALATPQSTPTEKEEPVNE